MAICAQCDGRRPMELIPTGRTVALPGEPSEWAGFRYPTRPEYELRCDCGWGVLGYLDGDMFVRNNEEA